METPTQDYAVQELERARTRILNIFAQVTDEQLQKQWLPILSPMIWDLGHIGNYEDLWLVKGLAGEKQRVTPPHLDCLYDAFQQPRAGRKELPLLGPKEAKDYITHVRERSLRAIEAGLLDPDKAKGDADLARNAFVLGLVLQHEHQHAETVLQARQAMSDKAVALADSCDGPSALGMSDPNETQWVECPSGDYLIGDNDNPWAYDNERPAHTVHLDSFKIARYPVTNAQWIEYLSDSDAKAPEYWEPAGDDSWRVQRFGTWHDVDLHEPVQHIDWHQATSFARWAGARLPTEKEWETACKLQMCESMLGGVWEWTSSDFTPWPSFKVFPYPEYSQAFFDKGYKVLRGGSWATDSEVMRPTFRNWDLPQRRQIFSGLRLANNG